MYLHRHAEKAVERVSKMFGAVLVTGPRQVGKTTMLKKCRGDMPYVSMDDPMQLAQAREAPTTFVADKQWPIFIDEIQKAPELFPLLKMNIDKECVKGMYYLSGSQQFQMMKNVSESMGGRVGIINLLPLSLRERRVMAFNEPFIPTEEYIASMRQHTKEMTGEEVWNIIQRGSMPEQVCNPDFDREMYYSAYIKTYIERDVRELTQVGDETKFMRFISAAACHTGQLLNISSLTRDVNISRQTAERWLSILVSSNLVYLLRPYSGNVLLRTIKTPKLYFLDTGLAAYLTRWTTPDVLRYGAMSGAYFETFVIGEVIKSYYNRGVEPPIYYYRDKYNEIDLLIERDGLLHPVKIKKHADVKKGDIRAFAKLAGARRGEGCVLCLYPEPIRLSDTDRAIPVWYL